MKYFSTTLALLIIAVCMWPIQSNASLMLDSAYREVDAAITVTTYPILGHVLYTSTMHPPARNTSQSGQWTQTSSAYGNTYTGGENFVHQAWAYQDSSITVDSAADTLSVTANGSVREDSGAYDLSSWSSDAYSYLSIVFTIDSGQYTYDFDITGTRLDSSGQLINVPISDGYILSGNFAGNTSDVIGPGMYEMAIKFFDRGPIYSGADPYNLFFEVTPNAPGSVTVPEPATILLFGTSIVGLAVFRQRKKTNK